MPRRLLSEGWSFSSPNGARFFPPFCHQKNGQHNNPLFFLYGISLLRYNASWDREKKGRREKEAEGRREQIYL